MILNICTLGFIYTFLLNSKCSVEYFDRKLKIFQSRQIICLFGMKFNRVWYISMYIVYVDFSRKNLIYDETFTYFVDEHVVHKIVFL